MMNFDPMSDLGNGRLVPTGGLTPPGSGPIGADPHIDVNPDYVGPGTFLANSTHIPAILFLVLAFVIWWMTRR